MPAPACVDYLNRKHPGGKDSFAVDREAAEMSLAIFAGDRLQRREPTVSSWSARSGSCPDQRGIRQFLDVGTGSADQSLTTYEVAQAGHHDARVVGVETIPR